jgi:hypothetical protein
MLFLKKTTGAAAMERRQFLINSGKVLLVLPAGWALANCSSNNSNVPPTNVTTATRTFTSSVTAGHTHDFTLSGTEIDTPPGGGIMRDTSTTLNHFHMVTLTAAQLSQIAAGQVVTMDTSLVDGHLHTFTFSLAATPARDAGVGGHDGGGTVGGSSPATGSQGSGTPGTTGGGTTGGY